MKTIKRIFLVIAALLASSGLSMPEAGEALIVYTALEDDEYPAYMELFKKQHPDIDVKIVRDSTGIITAKFLAEKNNPQADVIWGLAATSLIKAKKENLLAPYAPKGLEKVAEMFRDSGNPPSWVGIKAWETGFIVNTIELEANALPLPKSYADLIRPEYRGHIVMANPASSGTGYLTVAGILRLMGNEAGWSYLDKLDANMMQYTHSGSKPAKMAGQGECIIGVSFGYRGLKQKAKGEPVETVWPTEGSGWDLEANALVAKADIKDAAKTFLDFAISEDVMKLYAEVYPITSIDTGIPAPEGYPADPRSLIIDNDLDAASDARDAVLNEWSRRYDSKSESR